ncbi:Topoisomerase 1-associated factor 1 [Xylographa opegraphella]|nr:Topoisomerase 1-associated factor 1 [Xylographa opegraphella]
MDDDSVPRGVVDPEVRAYVYSLVSALGGTGADEEGRYVLGDDALACLKDIKRWLKLYDEKANRLDVARCLAEANLVKGDLLEILAAWPEDATEDRVQSKIASACLEILVPLTWPIEKIELQTTINHHRHIPYLQLAQISYKREILEHASSSILRTAVRIGLPSIALPIGERGSRDEGIIKLLLYFFRNIVMISAPQDLPVEWNEAEVSRSATIQGFHQQEVFALLLTIASNMGEDFNTQDVIVLEILFSLLKGIDIEKLFMNEAQMEAKKSSDLQGLMAKEAAMLRGYAKNAATRHNRFGTMIWVKRDDERMSSVSGQDVLSNSQKTLLKMDQSKKWNRPRQRGRNAEQDPNHYDIPIPLTPSASDSLRSFVEEFLDSGFNPLFSHLRRAIEREADRVLEVHAQQYFYLVSWFLEAERVRRKSKQGKLDKKSQATEPPYEADSFGIVASVLNQETFILLNRFMQDRLDLKSWHEVNAGMRCFTQILYTVQEMAESNLEEDQEIAENIQNRIFYEETTHDRILAILRGYKDQGFSYLEAATELSHVFLRMLERYSKENVDLQIRSRRRARKLKKVTTSEGEAQDTTADQDSEAEDVAEVQRVSKERKFDFSRFSSKFLTQSCIDTFVVFTSYYKDLSTDQLKRAHRFFYRVAFKQEMSVMLFRVDIIALFHRMMKGPEALNAASPMFREWDALARQLIRRMIKKLQQRPELAVEMLFSKINSTVFYLEYGYEKQTITTKPRAPAELEVKGGLSRDEQIAVIVAVLHEDKLDAIDFVKNALKSVIDERRSWEAEAEARNILNSENGQDTENEKDSFKAPSTIVKPDNDQRKIAMFKDNKLRLLMTLAGFERIGPDDDPDCTWIVPSQLTSVQLQETFDMIEKSRNDPITQYGSEDPVPVDEMLRRKTVIRPRAEFDDDSEGDGIATDGEEEFLFPAGGPTNRKSDALAELKKKRRKRRRDNTSDVEVDDDEARDAKRKARALADLEKRRKLKSEVLVHDSDDEDDEERDREFFAREAERRKGQSLKVLQALKVAKVDGSDTSTSKKRKRTEGGYPRRKKSRYSDTESGSEMDVLPRVRDVRSSPDPEDQDPSSDDDNDSETPLSSPQNNPLTEIELNKALLQRNTDSSAIEKVPILAMDGEDKEEEDEAMLLPSSTRMRGRLAVLDDSDDD